MSMSEVFCHTGEEDTSNYLYTGMIECGSFRGWGQIQKTAILQKLKRIFPKFSFNYSFISFLLCSVAFSYILIS